MNDVIVQVLAVVGPALLTFLLGHFNIVLPARKPVDPAKPVDPTVPVVPAVRPIGQGGIIDMLGLLFNQLAAHPAAPDVKVAAFQKLVEVQAVLTSK